MAVVAGYRIDAPDRKRAAALMVSGDLPAVAHAALRDGGDGLQAFQLQVFQPVEPMLAQSARSVAEALERTGAAATEVKLDGMRVQIHRDGDAVRVFTRSLRDVTASAPAAAVARSAMVDGEAIALGAGGRPRPFQETMSAARHVSIFLGTRAPRPVNRTPGNCRPKRSSPRYRSSCAVASVTAAATRGSSTDSRRFRYLSSISEPRRRCG